MSDLIDRQMAINEIMALIEEPDDDFNEGVRNSAVVIYQLPSAQPQWIPCSERLPDSGRYLASCQLSVFSPQVLNYDADDGEWFYDGCKSIGYTVPPITAWMPLPKPYGGESDDRIKTLPVLRV